MTGRRRTSTTAPAEQAVTVLPEVVIGAGGLDDAALAGLARDSVEASRATPGTRARLLAGIDAWLAG